MSGAATIGRVVVAGGAGAVGSLFAERLQQSGNDVVILDLAAPGPTHEGVTRFVQGDISDPGAEVTDLVRAADAVLLSVPEPVALVAIDRLARSAASRRPHRRHAVGEDHGGPCPARRRHGLRGGAEPQPDVRPVPWLRRPPGGFGGGARRPARARPARPDRAVGCPCGDRDRRPARPGGGRRPGSHPRRRDRLRRRAGRVGRRHRRSGPDGSAAAHRAAVTAGAHRIRRTGGLLGRPVGQPPRSRRSPRTGARGVAADGCRRGRRPRGVRRPAQPSLRGARPPAGRLPRTQRACAAGSDHQSRPPISQRRHSDD